MYPVLFKCPLFTIYTYGVFVALAFFVSSWLVSLEAKKKGLDDNVIYNLCVLLLVSGIISARIFYVVLSWDYFKADPLEIIRLQHGGLVWFGGLIGAIISSALFLKINRLPVMQMVDLFAPYVALGQAIGRIGCFFNGCCHGKEGSVGIFFPSQGRILFPSQLIDAVFLLSIFVILKYFGPRLRAGMVFVLYLILASMQRFFMEFLRGDERPFYWGLSIYQWISVLIFAAGITTYILLSWKKKSV